MARRRSSSLFAAPVAVRFSQEELRAIQQLAAREQLPVAAVVRSAARRELGFDVDAAGRPGPRKGS